MIIYEPHEALFELDANKYECIVAGERADGKFFVIRWLADGDYYAFAGLNERFTIFYAFLVESFSCRSSLGECLRVLFAGGEDEPVSVYCEPFSDDEVREVLFFLGGDGAVSAYFSGVPLVDILG